MPISPNSLTKTAVLTPCWLVKIWLSKVVLPLPKNPVMIVTGKPLLGAFIVVVVWVSTVAIAIAVFSTWFVVFHYASKTVATYIVLMFSIGGVQNCVLPKLRW